MGKNDIEWFDLYSIRMLYMLQSSLHHLYLILFTLLILPSPPPALVTTILQSVSMSLFVLFTSLFIVIHIVTVLATEGSFRLFPVSIYHASILFIHYFKAFPHISTLQAVSGSSCVVTGVASDL